MRLRPDPAGELTALPRLPNWILGGGVGEWRLREGDEKGKEEREKGRGRQPRPRTKIPAAALHLSVCPYVALMCCISWVTSKVIIGDPISDRIADYCNDLEFEIVISLIRIRHITISN